VAEFSEALLVIPRTLATNAALDASDLIAKLIALHSASQNSDDQKKKELKFTGIIIRPGSA
jgi:T-complex protein 1 subunit alpha